MKIARENRGLRRPQAHGHGWKDGAGLAYRCPMSSALIPTARHRSRLVPVPGFVAIPLLVAAIAGCTDKSVSPIPPDVKAIVFLQRTPRNNQMGNVFDYTSYEPGGRIVKLEPPTADGQLTVLTSDPRDLEALASHAERVRVERV